MQLGKGLIMPTIEQLDKMADMCGMARFNNIIVVEYKIKVMELTIAAMQAKALSDIAYLQGFNNATGRNQSSSSSG